MEKLTWGAKPDKNEKSQSSNLSEDDKSSVEVTGNHVYFYNSIDFDTALSLNKTLQEQTNKLLNNARNIGYEKPVLYLHINSGGGIIHAGTAIMDTINRLKKEVDIYTIIEGRSASAATFVSCVGTKRFITSNSFMLIHQLSALSWGKYSELKDDMDNFDLLMEMIKKIYSEYTSVPMKDLDEILKHDLYWDSKKCVEYNLVDEII